MEVVNRQKKIPNQSVQFLVVMGDARQSLLRDKWSDVKKSDCCFLLFILNWTWTDMERYVFFYLRNYSRRHINW